MRPRAISGIPAGLDENDSPGERFRKFVRMIVSVPKAEGHRMAEIHKGRKPGISRGRKNGKGSNKFSG